MLTNAKRDEPGFPKGHADPGESEAQTAARETAEETGLRKLEVWGDFTHELRYDVTRKGKPYTKRVVYFLARLRAGSVRLSSEHSAFRWVSLSDALGLLTHESLRDVLRSAALFGKDPALFDMVRAKRRDARAHLVSLPECTGHLLRHLEGGARLARGFARLLRQAGVVANKRAAGTGTLLHDVGRALGHHADHPGQGLLHLRETPLAAYGFACVSHFTKGATADELVEAGVAKDLVRDLRRHIDMDHLTWEEKCAALADACMRGDTPVPPHVRFDDLRARYDNHALIALQERRTEQIRKEIHDASGIDPLTRVLP